MDETQTVPPRRRLQELLAIPDRLRTEAEWDELHELEISLAPGNRADGAQPHPRQDTGQPRPRSNAPSAPDHSHPRPRPKEGGEGRKSFRNRRKKPHKPDAP